MGAHRSRRIAALGARLSVPALNAAPERPGGFYGRRKGKRLRETQDALVRTLLPRLRAEPSALLRAFEGPVSNLWLEIGFGGGEHLAAQARNHPEIGFIGCEPFVNGVAKLLRVVADENLANIRIWDQDGGALIDALPARSIARVYLLYPDPWPKRRHRKRRFISDQNLSSLARVMAPGAELRFATDIDDYAGWALARIMRSTAFRWTAGCSADWREPWTDWPGTRYEAKALREGRKSAYLTFERL